MSLVWPVAPTGGLDQLGLSLSREDTNGEHLENVHLASPQLRWRRDALQPPGVQRDQLSRNTCVHIPDGGLRCVTWNTRGLIGSPASSQRSREQKHNYFSRLTKNNGIICTQEIHGKDEFLQAIQVLVPQFRLHGTFKPNNLNAGGSAVVTHVVTCQGRDHIVKIQSGDRNLVVVNIHFEPDLTLKNLRERLRLVTPH